MSKIELSCTSSPLVSIGVPVRDGAISLEKALDSVVNQTYRNIEIIISDNCSSDRTEEICRNFAARDSRIQYYRQEKPLTAVENFRFVYEKSQGEYFMWAAHDDFRSDNYVETLLQGFVQNPSASIIFSDAYNINESSGSELFKYDFDSRHLTYLKKLGRQTRGWCHHIYGLIKAEYLSGYAWYDIEYGPDRPLLISLLSQGDFVYHPGARFYYFRSDKTDEDVALSTKYTKIKKFVFVRLAFYCAKAVRAAELRSRTPIHSLLRLFCYFYGCFHVSTLHKIKTHLYKRFPEPVKIFWRRLKRKLRSPQKFA